MNTPVIIGIMAALVAGTAITAALAFTYSVESDQGSFDTAFIDNDDETTDPSAGDPGKPGVAGKAADPGETPA